MITLVEKLSRIECLDDTKKILSKLVMKNLREFSTNDTQCSMSSLQPLNVEELDGTQQYPKVKTKKLRPTEKRTLEKEMEISA